MIDSVWFFVRLDELVPSVEKVLGLEPLLGDGDGFQSGSLMSIPKNI
jgi:hypothetical protein